MTEEEQDWYRMETALACLRMCTNETDKARIRDAFGIPAPYQPCPNCSTPEEKVFLSNKATCYRCNKAW